MSWFRQKPTQTPSPYVYPDADFDIEGLDVVAVERRMDNSVGHEATIIGYFVPEIAEIQEWSLNCGIGVHNTLVQRFRAKLDALKTGPKDEES